MPVAVGVDLGSTHCNVGVWHQGRPEVIANHHGLRATPTMVAFTDSEVLVGEAALSQMPKNVANTITGFKWMVGQSHAQLEPHVKSMLGELFGAQRAPRNAFGQPSKSASAVGEAAGARSHRCLRGLAWAPNLPRRSSRSVSDSPVLSVTAVDVVD